uniref:hypothetical protein n=1 Tax=Escherichia coli TaxID=562 RepID=UPI001F2F052F|nr:hypothetical protein [Escherichia coli]
MRKDAAFGVTVNGVSAAPRGEQKNVQLDLGLGDSRSFPIFFLRLPASLELLNLC